MNENATTTPPPTPAGASPSQPPAAAPAPAKPDPAPVPRAEETPKPAEVPKAPATRQVGKFHIYPPAPIPSVGPPRRPAEFDEVLQALKTPGENFVIEEKQRSAVRSAAVRLNVPVAIRKHEKLPDTAVVYLTQKPEPKPSGLEPAK